MSGGLVTAAYIVAAILFIFSWPGFRNMKRLARVTISVSPDGDCVNRNHFWTGYG